MSAPDAGGVSRNRRSQRNGNLYLVLRAGESPVARDSQGAFNVVGKTEKGASEVDLLDFFSGTKESSEVDKNSEAH